MPVLTDPFGWFTLEIPEGWDSQTEDCVTTLTSPASVGVAYVSGGRHAGGRQPAFGGADFLGRFLASLGIDVEEGAITSAGDASCRRYTYQRQDAEGRLWRYWSVTDDETALLISYTCDVRDASREEDVVEGMVRSVRLYHSSTVR